MKEERGYIYIHIIGWFAFLALPIIFSPDITNSELIKEAPFQRDFIGYIILILFFYLHFYILIPRFYFKKRYLIYIVALIICFGAITIAPKLIINFLQNVFSNFEVIPNRISRYSFHSRHELQHIISHYFFQFVMVIAISFLIKIYNRWEQTEEEKLLTELSYLKSQMNPHFLFNTLNSIYSLAIQERANVTADSIVKLSGMMRYLISETDIDFIALEKEITYISDYIDLQKLRLEDTVNISFNIIGDVTGKEIAPFLLIHFIENAFKFGVNPEKKSTININIIIEKNELTLVVENNKVYTTFDSTIKSGLGIGNTKKRLQLVYPSKHQLIITDKDEEFKILLKLKLK